MKPEKQHNHSNPILEPLILITILLFLPIFCGTSQTVEEKNLAQKNSSSGNEIKRFRVIPPPEDIVKKLNLSNFYKKYCDADGLPIVASEKVSDYALMEAAWILTNMIGHRRDIIEAIANARVRVAVMASEEYTTDIPEHSDLKPKDYWDRRARGLGATRRRPAVSCGEENLLSYRGDPYAAENILIHEFGHVIHEIGLRTAVPSFEERLKRAFNQATEKGLWKNTYAATNPNEYWAEGVQSWFDCNRQNDSIHNHVNTREELKQYDPELAKLLEEVFGDKNWRYEKPQNRKEQPIHLKGYNPPEDKVFRWRTATQNK
ncbi:MAG: hypothetical protein N2487_05560 [Verrucomicrobiae bacterium]|nr:hypothetical protein [Verrucomicrobiae bacterium]